MNTLNKCRNGNRSLNRTLNRRCDRYATIMLDGARRPRQPNELVLACRLLEEYLRLGQRMAKDDPHLFGPRARDYLLDTQRQDEFEQEIETAVRRVYDLPAPGGPIRGSTLWTDRYSPRPEKRRRFLKWFHEQYPAS